MRRPGWRNMRKWVESSSTLDRTAYTIHMAVGNSVCFCVEASCCVVGLHYTLFLSMFIIWVTWDTFFWCHDITPHVYFEEDHTTTYSQRPPSYPAFPNIHACLIFMEDNVGLVMSRVFKVCEKSLDWRKIVSMGFSPPMGTVVDLASPLVIVMFGYMIKSLMTPSLFHCTDEQHVTFPTHGLFIHTQQLTFTKRQLTLSTQWLTLFTQWVTLSIQQLTLPI